MPRKTLPAALAACLLLAGCGGGEAPVPVREATVAIGLDDFFLTPQKLRAQRGRITFTATNQGRLPHNFRLRRGDDEPIQITTLLPGRTGSASARLRRGRYEMVCTVGNHEELGMRGTLVVR